MTLITDPGLTLIQCAVLVLNQCGQNIVELRAVVDMLSDTVFALWLVPEIDYEYLFTLL